MVCLVKWIIDGEPEKFTQFLECLDESNRSKFFDDVGNGFNIVLRFVQLENPRFIFFVEFDFMLAIGLPPLLEDPPGIFFGLDDASTPFS